MHQYICKECGISYCDFEDDYLKHKQVCKTCNKGWFRPLDVLFDKRKDDILADALRGIKSNDKGEKHAALILVLRHMCTNAMFKQIVEGLKDD